MNTPKAIPGTVEMVSVEWAMKNLVDSIDGYGDGRGGVNFGTMLAHKACDSHFGDLIETILRQGFRVPVCFYKSCYGDTQEWALGNGHHRMSAAILLCLDELPVYWADYGEGFMATAHTDTEELLWESGDGTLGDFLAVELADLVEGVYCGECDVNHMCCCDCG